MGVSLPSKGFLERLVATLRLFDMRWELQLGSHSRRRLERLPEGAGSGPPLTGSLKCIGEKSAADARHLATGPRNWLLEQHLWLNICDPCQRSVQTEVQWSPKGHHHPSRHDKAGSGCRLLGNRVQDARYATWLMSTTRRYIPNDSTGSRGCSWQLM
jgi:hypothetical protein